MQSPNSHILSACERGRHDALNGAEGRRRACLQTSVRPHQVSTPRISFPRIVAYAAVKGTD